MRIELKCACGSTAVWTSTEFINSGGAKDAQGRVFVVELRAAEWLDLHRICLSATLGRKESA